jgi:hypothetical protein
MLEGIGARTTADAPSTMVSARITCISCHQSKEVTSNGSVLWKASTKTCAHCHDNTTIDRLWEIHESLRASLDNIEQCLNDLRQAMATRDPTATTPAQSKLDDIQSDLNFLRIGNGIHNIHYASTVTEALVKELSVLCDEFNVARPQVSLPSRDEFLGGAAAQPPTVPTH